MKTIRCPNCGNKMKAMSAPCKVTILAVDAQWRCQSCNVCGPSARAKNAYLAIRDAARLTREWIARMEMAVRCEYANGYTQGFEDGGDAFDNSRQAVAKFISETEVTP